MNTNKEDTALKTITALAKKWGLAVLPAKNEHTPTISKRGLLIDGKLCLVKRCKKRKLSKETRLTHPGYATFSIAGKDVPAPKFLITFVNIPRLPTKIFIIPYEIVRKNFFEGREKAIATLHIPLEKIPVYHNHVSKVDWSKYENAWYLISRDNSEVFSEEPLFIDTICEHLSGREKGYMTLSLGRNYISAENCARLFSIVVPSDDKFKIGDVLPCVPSNAVPVEIFFGK